MSWNWAILGCGNIAEKFVEDLRLLKEAQLYAAASRSTQKAQNFANKYGFKKAYGSYKEMVKDPQVDVVYIATPHSHHHEHTLLCLEHKKAVLCEKAFALNLKQANKMVESARRNKVFLMEAFWTQFQPGFRKAIEILQSGRLGKMKIVRSDFAFNGPYDPENRLYNLALGGGSLLDIGIYPVFAALKILGLPSEIAALAQFSPTGSEESISISFKYPDGKLASLVSSFEAYSDVQTEVFCEKGFIRISRRWINPTRVIIWEEPDKEEILTFNYHNSNGYQHEARHVMECLDKGLLESPELPLSFSLDLMRTLDKIREAGKIRYPDVD